MRRATSAHIVLPKTPFHLSCSADCAILVVGIDAGDLELQVSTLAGENVPLPAVVPDIVALTGGGTTLGHYLEFLSAESRRPDSLLRHATARVRPCRRYSRCWFNPSISASAAPAAPAGHGM